VSTPATGRDARSGEVATGIGVFDSGIGGLTVFDALRRTLPTGERLLYLGDTARVPYGTKSDETVIRYALEGARFLARRGMKTLVVACNTMSAIALPALERAIEVPVIGVIAPGAAAACRATKSRAVAVIGTSATIKSGAYARAIASLMPEAVVTSRACPMFVPLAEEGWVDNDVSRATARAYLGDLENSGIDTLVLGCTHYPLLRGVIAEAVGRGVTLVDSAEATAAVVRRRLEEEGLLAGGGSPSRRPAAQDHFYVTDSSERFREVGARFLGHPLERLELVDLME
jgi:glutamate racemase